jgi:spore coat protein U domain-containing protein, fimbrial subunit CupE1/2/3/6
MSVWRVSAIVALLLAFAVRAEGACTVSATGVSFGTYNVFAASDNTSTGTVTYQCGNKDKNVEITISQGSSTTFLPRTLKKGTESLSYNLYLDAAFTSIWGDGGSGTGTYTIGNPPNNTDVNLTVYGRIPAQQDVSAGGYTDTVIATINF